MNNDVIKVQLSCGVDYYKGDKGDKPIKGVDYFTQEDIADIVEQIETGGVDLDGYATKEYVDNAVSGVVVSETDPTVPAWAKQANKPSYTASEVGALPADTQLFSGNYNDLRNKPAIPTVPVNVSAFNNDAGYLTSHQSLNDYATKSYVETAIRGAESGLLKRSVVQALPTSDIDENTIYMVAKTGSTGDVYDEYLYVNSNWEHIGSTDVDLTGYATESYVDTAIANIDIPAPIVIQVGIAGQPTVDSDGNYRIPLTITSNNMAEAYAQYQTHPSTVGIAVDLSAMGISTKMYLDCESFYRYDDGNGGYNYETYGEFNDSSIASFGFEFQNVNIYLNTETNSSEGRLIGIATVHQLASKANSADLATVATSGDYNDLSNKPTIPTAYTLPTATTSTLGGVKVDGSTITIDANGVISSSASGGSSYTFTNGLTERNGTVSWNLNSRIQAGTKDYSVAIGNNNTVSGIYAFAEGSSNQATGLASHAEGYATKAQGTYSHAEGSNTIASGSYQHAEGKFNVEDSNDIFQNIAGNGASSARATMFARDWNGNEYLSGNLFVGCNDFTTTSSGLTTANAGGGKVATESYVDTAIANIPSGSGTTYTAGNGINIDSNGVISQNFSQLGILHMLPHFDVPNSSNWRTTLQALADSLNNTGYGVVDASALYNFTPAQLNEALGNKQYGIDYISNMDYSIRNPANVSSYNYNSTSTLFSRSAFDMYYFILTPTKIYYAKSNSVLWRYLWYSISTDYITVSTNGAVNYTDFRLPQVIKQLDTAISSKQDAIIPTAPTTDGNYVLKVSVSSGTPTYSWVAE